MAGLCEDGNEPSGSVKAISNTTYKKEYPTLGSRTSMCESKRATTPDSQQMGNTFNIVFEKVIRLITHLPRVASRRKFHDELELPTIDEFIARLARNLYAEARANPNNVISGLGQYDPRLRRRHQTGPLAILLRQEDREAGVTPRFW
ncbi:hypothetical protein ANN_04763 [Periplaneta americana]|uniref:Uncharacterized protein n=1 Tax=Periplaneta americana TaxID=6978 RepID=A0ABQ8T9D0_PERAM|nr:hypothetical protein ANN_04763 [Periplaneta americana]